MTRLRPFDYAVSYQKRRHEPVGYKDYQNFKPWLRDEFMFRCVYYPNDPKIHELFVQEFGFPYDLPDLRKLKPPKGNPSKSHESCYYALRERGELPETY